MSEPAEKPESLELQFGGSHYKGLAIEPIQYAHANKLMPAEFSAIKYLTRHHLKGGAGDVKKAAHFVAMILEMQYGIKMTFSFEDAKKAGPDAG